VLEVGEESIFSSDNVGQVAAHRRSLKGEKKSVSGTHSVEWADYSVCGCDAV
jgi:hypothetical protein